MKKKIIIAIAFILLLLLIGTCIYFTFTPDNPLLPTDGTATDWNGKQDLNKPTIDIPKIAIPGITSLVFYADTMEQKVNFYNPEENDCLFLMRLCVDNTCYWESGYIEPGKGYYDITLSEPIPTGNYSATLEVHCFQENGTALNSANVEFELTVE